MTPSLKLKECVIALPRRAVMDAGGLEAIVRLRNSIGAIDFLILNQSQHDIDGEFKWHKLNESSLYENWLHVEALEDSTSFQAAAILWAHKNGARRLACLAALKLPDSTKAYSFFEALFSEKWNVPIVVGRRIDRPPLEGVANFLTGLKVDATSPWRIYQIDSIPEGFFSRISKGRHSFGFHSLYALRKNGIEIAEISLSCDLLTDKKSWGHIAAAIGLFFKKHVYASDFVYASPKIVKTENMEQTGEQMAWDNYWGENTHSGKWLYDMIAIFYRKFLIRPAVNHFLGKYFSDGASLLHAGCGSGMVDVDISRRMNIVALDISPAGLLEYARNHDGKANLMLGSILDIPAMNESYDGAFNLGVMEHFHAHEIERILHEINRVLKPGGHAVFFWPPIWGLSVNVLKLIHWLLNDVLGKNITLHPPEYSDIKSRYETNRWLENAGFKMKEFYFGPRDMFTHQIVVAQKVARPNPRQVA